MPNRGLIITAVAAAGAGGYYYTQMNKDQTSQLERDSESFKKNAQATFDSTKDVANSAAAAGQQKINEASQAVADKSSELANQAQKKIDEADRTVQKKAGGWFGSSK